MKTPLLNTLCATALLLASQAWAEQPVASQTDVQALPQIMPEDSAQGENCDSNSGGCKQMKDMRSMMSEMMASGSSMAGAACGSDGKATTASATGQMESRMDRMQAMMGRMMR